MICDFKKYKILLCSISALYLAKFLTKLLQEANAYFDSYHQLVLLCQFTRIFPSLENYLLVMISTIGAAC